MRKISSDLQGIREHYDVVVVGSGYGGAIAASRLARAGRSVCLLERGREIRPGEFPDTQHEAVAQLQVDGPAGRVGSRTGLYEFHVDEDINVFKGCGLGGTSLVNANVSLRADPRVFDDPRWPAALRGGGDALLAAGYQRAEAMLQPNPYPDGAPRLHKLEALERSARAMGTDCRRTPINVAFEDRTNAAGVEQAACTLCGDCVTGCNYGSKNTLLMNYLPDAEGHGAELFAQVDVRCVARRDDRWLVYYQPLRTGREAFDAPDAFVAADVVVLAAGSLGSTEILLRSRRAGLALSQRLGHAFTGNGDVLGFAYNGDEPVDGVGFGHRALRGRTPVGPCITGVIDTRGCANFEDGMVIEEGAIPGALAGILAPAFALARREKRREGGFPERVERERREVASLLRGGYHGAVNHSQTFLVMSHDDAAGRLELDAADRLRILWPGVGDRPGFRAVNDALGEAAQGQGADYVPNPVWSKLLRHALVTVHPLGGCPMGEDAATGVVDARGRVFAGESGEAVHEGLYVCDGAVMPRSLGVNPLLTIAALAERNVALLAADRGWEIDYAERGAQQRAAAAGTPGVRFTESMKGWISTEVLDDFGAAARRGERDESPCSFVLTITALDLDAMIRDPDHPASIVGTVEAPALAPDPLVVTGGRFQLFVADPQSVGTREMRYRMPMRAPDGRSWFFDGFKTIRHDRAFDLWSDTTTLYVTIHAGEDERGPVAAKGVLRISPTDFARQLTTMEARNVRSRGQRLETLARFGEFFAGPLLEEYGGIFARPTVLDPNAPPRRKRPLRAGVPELHFFDTDDGNRLRLARYRGGERGPVVLVHGMGACSRLFSIDTIDTNLVEYLFAHGFDVWLFDWRGSVLLPASEGTFDGDQCARFDYPAAVKKLREVTGRDAFHWIVHCVGSITFFMSLLRGLEGVRSVVALQVATHQIPPPMTRLKVGLHLPNMLEHLGIHAIDTRTTTGGGFADRLFDEALRAYPLPEGQQCNSAVCKRITFLYSLCYQHEQLNRATHDAMHEMFGIANLRMMSHLAACARAGHLVDADGQEIYMPHLERLDLPITFLHGALNQVWLPEATETTYDLLRAHFDPEQYRRVLIPNYGHLDPVFGKDAVHDTYEFFLEHLKRVGA